MHGKTELWVNESKESVNKEQYVKIIKGFAIPFINSAHNGEGVLLHDGASPHTARYTANKLRRLNIHSFNLTWGLKSSKFKSFFFTLTKSIPLKKGKNLTFISR